jgi:hypothetical protein
MFFGFEERFFEDAKRAELSVAAARVRWKKVKTGWAGSLWAKLRLIVMAAPLLTLLLPSATLLVKLPFYEKPWDASALGLYGMFSDGTLQFLRDVRKIPVFGPVYTDFGLVILAVAALAVISLAIFLCSVFSFPSPKKMAVAVTVLCGLGVAGAVADLILANRMNKAAAGLGSDFLAGSFGPGTVAALAAFLAVAFINVMLARNGVVYHFAEGDVERAAIFTRLKAGEVSLGDLPYPVVETAETRALEEKIQAEIRIADGESLAEAELTKTELNEISNADGIIGGENDG